MREQSKSAIVSLRFKTSVFSDMLLDPEQLTCYCDTGEDSGEAIIKSWKYIKERAKKISRLLFKV